MTDDDELVHFVADDLLKLELLRLVDALGLERTERLLRSIRRSVPSGHDLSWSGQTMATHVLREWVNTSHVEYLTPNEAWDKTGEILRAYLTGGAMRILELPQGHRHPSEVSGLTWDEAMVTSVAWDDAYLEKFPQFRATHRPSWKVLEVDVTRRRVPWGHEWYCVGPDNKLVLHSADYDSSG